MISRYRLSTCVLPLAGSASVTVLRGGQGGLCQRRGRRCRCRGSYGGRGGLAAGRGRQQRRRAPRRPPPGRLTGQGAVARKRGPVRGGGGSDHAAATPAHPPHHPPRRPYKPRPCARLHTLFSSPRAEDSRDSRDLPCDLYRRRCCWCRRHCRWSCDDRPSRRRWRRCPTRRAVPPWHPSSAP